MKNNIADMKVELPRILGSTTINHAARTELGLNCSEYVMMDYIYRCVKKKKIVDIKETFVQTGFTAEQQKTLLTHLVEKGFVYPKNVSPPEITDRWDTAFADIEVEFNELFWKRNDKTFFTGSKKKSYGMYYKTRKKYSREFMISQRDAYARYLELEREDGFDRRVMMCEKFLLPANEYFLVDWEEMGDDVKKRLKAKGWKEPAEKTETITAKSRKEAYEQDSKQ